MTVSTDTNKVKFAGNGVTVAFSFPNKFFKDTDLEVRLRVDATEVETVQTLTTDYTVTGAGLDAGGTVTMVVAPATGESLIIRRILPLTQESDFVTQDPFPAEVVEEDHDRSVMLSQQLEEKQDRALRFQVGSSFVGVFVKDLIAGKLLKVSSDLAFIEMSELDSDLLDDAQAILDQIEDIRDQIIAIVDALEGQNITVERFNGGTATFVLTVDAGQEELIYVFIDGVYQQKDTFSYVSATKTVTLDESAPAGTNNVEIVYGTTISIFNVPDGSITTAKLAADAVTGAKIGDDQINSEHYVAASIDPEHLATSSVETAKIAALAVTNAKIANATITEAKLASGLVLGSQSLLEEQTASASVTIDFTSNIDSTFDYYIFRGWDIIPATNDTNLHVLVSTNGGTSFLGGSTYFYSITAGDNAANASLGSGVAQIVMNYPVARKWSNTTNTSGMFSLELQNPASTSLWKNIMIKTVNAKGQAPNLGEPVISHVAAQARTLSAVNAIRFVFGSGNIASGRFALYGVKTS